MEMYKMKHSKICNIIWDSNSGTTPIKHVIEYIKNAENLNENHLLQIEEQLLNRFYPLYKKKWKIVYRKKESFLQKFADFLEQDFIVELRDHVVSENLQRSTSTDIATKRGRPLISYSDGSDRTKKRRTCELAGMYSRQELIEAAEYRDENYEETSDSEIDIVYSTDEKKRSDVLAMYLDLQLTLRTYENMRYHNRKIKGTSYPSYRTIVTAKEDCYPDHIQALDVQAEVDLISLLGHTVKRILLCLKVELKELSTKKLLLIGKWGMDGASGQQTTRQKWKNQSEEDKFSDSAVFIISFAPLMLKADDDEIWRNTSPSSVRSCRVIKYEFTKENKIHALKEFNYYEDLLQKVQTYCFDINEIPFQVSFDMKFTMIDGKMCNFVTNQDASNRCNICNVGPKFINDLDYVKNLEPEYNKSNYRYGLSTLHCWIRFLEYSLHIAYNLDFKASACVTTEHKILKQERKRSIQKALQAKLSLPVDIVKQGFGTSNTGNVARTFFRHANITAECTGLNIDFLTRLHDILQAITCSKYIDCDKFEAYCLQTAEICIELYGWYKMPPSVHKVLIHGADIARSFELPIGWYSEEPQEGNNKTFRKARAEHSRMTDRQLTNLDTLRHLIISSDPLINHSRRTEKSKPIELTEGATKLLKE